MPQPEATLRFDDFERGELLGVGTVGTVYRVRSEGSGEVYALKLLAGGISDDKLIVSRFEREMLILSKLEHPNIVRYYGGGTHQGRLFFVMELVEVGTLKTLLAQVGRLSWHEAADCGRQIAAALQYAHNHGIIHRDLKPGNIYLTVDAQAKLGDFGIARDLRSLDITDTGLTVGTYAYMCPELVRGQRNITGKVDLYALGCLLFEMLSGRPPYLGDNFAEIFEQHLHSKPPRVRRYGVKCPEPMEQIIVDLLAKDPEERPFNARTIQGLLGEMIDQTVNHAETDMAGQAPDRAAGEVRPLEALLRRQSQLAVPKDSTSWGALGIVVVAVLLAIVVMGLMPSIFASG